MAPSSGGTSPRPVAGPSASTIWRSRRPATSSSPPVPAASGAYARGADSLERLIADTTLWLNGIATGPDGALYAADDRAGTPAREPRHRRVAAACVFPRATRVSGIDGLYVHRGALVWIQNGIEPARVVQAPLSGDGLTIRELRTLDRGHPDYDGPTTGVMVGDTLFYVATAQFGAIRSGGRVAPADSMRENVVLRVTVPR